MSKDYDLHHDDYLNIVNDVIHQTTPAGVKTIIEERYEKYSPHNKDFLGTLLDVVDNYDGFSQDYQYIGSSQDILQVFNELVFFDQFPYNHK